MNIRDYIHIDAKNEIKGGGQPQPISNKRHNLKAGTMSNVAHAFGYVKAKALGSGQFKQIHAKHKDGHELRFEAGTAHDHKHGAWKHTGPDGEATSGFGSATLHAHLADCHGLDASDALLTPGNQTSHHEDDEDELEDEEELDAGSDFMGPGTIHKGLHKTFKDDPTLLELLEEDEELEAGGPGSGRHPRGYDAVTSHHGYELDKVARRGSNKKDPATHTFVHPDTMNKVQVEERHGVMKEWTHRDENGTKLGSGSNSESLHEHLSKQP